VRGLVHVKQIHLLPEGRQMPQSISKKSYACQADLPPGGRQMPHDHQQEVLHM